MHMFTDETDFTDVHALQSVVGMFGRSSSLQRILKHTVGLRYDTDVDFPGDGVYDHQQWVIHHRNVHAPPRHFVWGAEEGHRSASSSTLYRRSRHFNDSSPDIASLSFLDVEQNENDTKSRARISQENKKGKTKAEKKKKKKKLKQKERKRREKLEKEKQNATKNKSANEDAQQDEEVESKPGCDEEDADSSGKPAEHSDSSGGSEQESSDEDDDSCASEELDMTSSFVSKAALIARRKMEVKPKPSKSERKVADKEPKTTHNRPNESQEVEKKDSAAASSSSLDDHVKISNSLAEFGNKCASTGDFNMAVKYFTDAIKYNPTEFKLFGNRSFCFEKLHEYEKALTDAELSLGICPGWVKGLFRKGRALTGLKRYDEAAQAFRDVLKHDSLCAEAAQELMRVQITQLMEFGFTREESSNALIIHGTVTKSLEVLSKLHRGAGGVKNVSPPLVQVANVTGVSPVLSANRGPAPPPPPSPPAAAASAQLTAKDHPINKPLDPFGELFPVWVGNLNYMITGSVITNLFSKAGTIGSVKVLSAKRCAFVNFTKQESCDEAIRRFHGFELNGATLAVRYPDRIAPGMNISKSAQRANYPAR